MAYGRTPTTVSGRIRRWATGRPRLSASRIWPSGYPWQRPCSSLATGPVQNTGQVTAQELGTDDDLGRFAERVRKLAKAPPHSLGKDEAANKEPEVD